MRWSYWGVAVWGVLGACGCGGNPVDGNARTAAEWALKRGGTVTAYGSDKALKTPAALPAEDFGLQRIDLKEQRVRDKDLTNLAGLSHLKSLNLYRTDVTDKGLENLKELTGLETLELSYTRITDKGLESIAALPKLKKLFLYGTRVTDEGVNSLQERKPGLTILRDAGDPPGASKK